MDTTITTADETQSEATVTATPAQSTGTESVASENTQTEGGSPQGSTEGSQQDGQTGRKRWSIQDEVKELRAQRRELRERLSSFDEVRNELAQLREEMTRRTRPTTAKDPARFWQDPEGTLDSKLDERLERLQNNMFERLEMTREQEYARQALEQEQRSATEFIRTQKGYDPADDDELVEIIAEIPNKQHLSPQWVAEFAWLKLQQSRGVGDRTLAKQRASAVQGQPPGVGFGRKVWSKADFDAACDMLEKNPTDPKNSELLKELESAHKEGRVR